ncbi:MAG: sigma-54-dependent Fis family transcriptional regulator, partial [Deltaproteobacteria bacterium]|nr:sigma-54-dependent Fis family transcriptional regulator [Deltaproteobacteria bacterium]
TFSSRFSLLFVDDEPQILSLLKRTLAGENYLIHTASNGEDALNILSNTQIAAALVDLVMPGMDGFSLLKEIRERYPEIMVAILTGYGGVKEAVTAMKLGAVDFLEKPFQPARLQALIAQFHRIWELREENRTLKTRVETRFVFDPLVGQSTSMLALKELIAQVGPSRSTILIQGETGTGKELVARAIHAYSPRAENAFVPVDCAAISETVMESELFGHTKGAFTGAHISTLGLIRSAQKGTLFLDEIGELSPSVQAKLLRTVQEKEVRPVGSSQSYPVDIRVLAATNRDLAREVEKGLFREDLYYRLNVLTIRVPPLRDLRDDISLLANHFLKRFSTTPSPVRDVSQEALLCMERYVWPGNIRELENVVRRAIALGKGDVIRPKDLPHTIYTSSSEKTSPVLATPSGSSLASYEIAAIKNALSFSKNNRKEAARILEIGEATLYRKIKKYGIGLD